MSGSISALAAQIRSGPTKRTTRTPWGICLHTTGSGVVATARRTSKPPLEVALRWYAASQGTNKVQGANGYPWGGPGYVIDHDGRIYQIADDDTLTNHCGGPWRQVYLSGRWVERCSPRAVAEWHRQWPAYRSPQALFPSTSPNVDLVGVEMIPCGAGFGEPMRPGLKFTAAQHDAAARLAGDIATRWAFPFGWATTPRLCGHEDVQLIERHDAGGGWDPGSLRQFPYFDFAQVRKAAADQVR